MAESGTAYSLSVWNNDSFRAGNRSFCLLDACGLHRGQNLSLWSFFQVFPVSSIAFDPNDAGYVLADGLVASNALYPVWAHLKVLAPRASRKERDGAQSCS
jgi:hypothetical protein